MRTSRKKGGGSREMRSASELLYINPPLKKEKMQDFYVLHVLYGAHCIPMKIKVLVLRMLGCSLLVIIEWLELRAAAESRSGATLLL